MVETAPEAPHGDDDSLSSAPVPASENASGSALGSRNATHVQLEGRDVYIVGTAHVSPKSVEEVTRVIREVKPDTVCVELDAMRHEALVDENRSRKLDIFAVI